MGRKNDAVLSYLEDNERFAELFNCFYFGGREAVRAEDISEASEVYVPDNGKKGGQRIRDIKRYLESGACLKILAIEAQNDISYLMPWRIMEYDCLEYQKQIRKVQRANDRKEERGEKRVYQNAGERLGRFCKQDKIAPVYTICLYHGQEEWDGPRCLKDMMDFGPEHAEEWKENFADYPMRLVSVNDFANGSGFKTSLREVFALLPYREDREGLLKMLEENPEYQRMDEETAHTISVLLDVKFMDRKEKYREEEGYNMCQAIQEMVEEGRKEGRLEGRKEGRLEGRREEQAEGIRILIQMSRDDGVEENEIMCKLKKYYLLSEEDAREVLGRKQRQ